MKKVPIEETVPQELREFFKKVPKAAIAFSGGVDSSYLLYAAKSCGVEVTAYYVNSQFQPQFELNDAKWLADELIAEMKLIPIDVLSDETVCANPEDRCYYCKQVIFNQILAHAEADGYDVLMDGTNASDDAGDRPGMRALAELKVLSPLRAAGLTKADVRRYSKEAELFTWAKPSYACLATRIPTGTRLDAETLEKVEKAEDALAEMGFSDFRARVLGNAAKLQFPEDQIDKAVQQREEIMDKLSPLFEDVFLDFKVR